MPSYTSSVMATVGVSVGCALVARYAHIKQNEAHPGWKQWEIKPVMHPVIGGFALGLFLFAAGMINERIATLLCLLVVVSSLVINGAPLFAYFNNYIAPPKTK